VKVIPFDPAHAVELANGPLKIETERPSTDLAAHYELAASNGLSFSAVDNGWLIAAAGLMPLWPGVAEAWLLASSRVDRHPVTIGRLVRQGLFEKIETEQLHRVQAVMRSDQPMLIRWARFLGMKHEGQMLAYDQRRADYDRWAWTRKDDEWA